MTQKIQRKFAFFAIVGLCMAAMTLPVFAKELPAGTVISAANLDKIANDTFEGHKIKALLTKPMEVLIRKWGLKIPLEHSSPLNVYPAMQKATKKYAGTTTLGPDHKLHGYVKGVPFPLSQINVNDPECGWKLAWDYWMANPNTTDSWSALGEVYIIDADRGVINNFVAANMVTKWEGRLFGDTTLPGRPSEHSRFLLVLTAPYDVAGIGVFTRKYRNGDPSTGYVYVKSLRRTRRTAGGKAWVNPQPKMTLLNDDSQGLQGNPLWYKNWQCKGVRYVLEVPDMPDANYANKIGTIKHWVKTSEWPHWNYNNTKWQPRKVFVLEGTPPDYHPYGKKVLYMDAKYPFFYHGEFYDKKGNFWRFWQTRYYPFWNGDCHGNPALGNFNTWEVDVKAGRTTYINQPY